MDDYTKVSLAQIDPSLGLPVDIYLSLNEKYIKFKNSGEAIGKEKFDYFLSKNMNSIYILTADFPKFSDWIKNSKSASLESMVEEAGEENRAFIDSTLAMEEKVFEVFSDQDLTPARVAIIQDNVEEVVKKMKDNSNVAKGLKALLEREEHIAAHSVNVANLAVFFAMAAGHGNSFTLENVYLAGIFHDYGKLKFPPEVLTDKNHPEYQDCMYKHPEDSCEIVKKSEGIPDQVFEMIIQHHERFDGQGYPYGIMGESFSDLSQILSMANEIDKFLVDNKNLGKETSLNRALTLLKSGEDSKWSPKFFPRVAVAFEKGFVIPKVTTEGNN